MQPVSNADGLAQRFFASSAIPAKTLYLFYFGTGSGLNLFLLRLDSAARLPYG